MRHHGAARYDTGVKKSYLLYVGNMKQNFLSSNSRYSQRTMEPRCR